MDFILSVEGIQCCSLSCIHNFIETIPLEKLGINQQILTQILSLVFNAEPISKQLMEESTNTLRALITRMPALNLTADQLEVLCSRCQTIGSLSVKMNVINLMSILAQRSTDLQFIEKITVLLMAGLQTESDLVLKAELFDALIDIHSEDNKTDSLLIKLDLINRLKQLAVLFKNEVSPGILFNFMLSSALHQIYGKFFKLEKKVMKTSFYWVIIF